MIKDRSEIEGINTITVTSSPYAVEVYLGFVDTNSEQTVDGMRFTPMEYKVIKTSLIKVK